MKRVVSCSGSCSSSDMSETSETRPIVIRNAETGEVVCQFDPPDDLWLDMQAYCAAANVTMQQLFDEAVTHFFRERDRK